MITQMIIADASLMIKMLITGGVALIGGGVVSYLIWNITLNRKSINIISEAKTEAEVIKKDKILQAKEKWQTQNT